MEIEDALSQCESMNLKDWDLVLYVQKLVSKQMAYSYLHCFRLPKRAFQKGEGYCYQQAAVTKYLLKRLGVKAYLVFAAKCQFPEKEYNGIKVSSLVSGHVWVRAVIDGTQKDICPGDKNNVPGKVHFKPLSKVHKWNRMVFISTYFFSPLINKRRHRKILSSVDK